MTNLKALQERRAEAYDELQAIVTKADGEKRAMTEEETTNFDKLETEIRSIDSTIEREERSRDITEVKAEMQTTDKATLEARAFEALIRGTETELRAGEQNFTMTNNGALIPETIANRVIKAIEDRCPILAGATLYNIAGTLKIPVYGKANSTHDIAVGYQSEFTEITADAGAFTSVDLGGYLAGALTLIGRTVINNAQFPVTDFVINEMADKCATWIEDQLLNGTGSNEVTGALTTTNTMALNSTSAITADDLISLQARVKQANQRNACWTMHPDTFTYIKKLKDTTGRYLLQDDITGEFPYRLLGKPVYLSDNMPTIAAGAKVVLYGDYSGMAVNFREGISIEVLREKYATQHAIGVVSWFELDAVVADAQKLATLAMKSGT